MHGNSRKDVPDPCDFTGVLGGRQQPAVARLRSLGQFHLDHFHGFHLSLVLEQQGVKVPLVVPTTKISRSELKNEITSRGDVIWADASLTGIVRKPSFLCPAVEGEDGPVAQ